MNAAKQAAWLFLTMIVLACSGWYFARSPVLHKLDDTTLLQIPDSVIKTLTVRQFNEQGRMANRLETPLLRHTPQNDTHFLQKPIILITQDNQSPWHIQSEKAIAINGQEQITFIKNVIIHQDKGEHNDESTLRTEKIIYFPNLQKAATNLAVTFEQSGTVVNSVGMNAWLNEKKVQLLHQARGHYAPSHD